MIFLAGPNSDHALNGIKEQLNVFNTFNDYFSTPLRQPIELADASGIKCKAVPGKPDHRLERMGEHGPVHDLEYRLNRWNFLFLLQGNAILLCLIAFLFFC